MEKQIERQCRANAVFTDEAYLKTRYICREDGTYTIRVGRGERRDVLACKELYGKAVKTAQSVRKRGTDRFGDQIVKPGLTQSQTVA